MGGGGAGCWTGSAAGGVGSGSVGAGSLGAGAVGAGSDGAGADGSEDGAGGDGSEDGAVGAGLAGPWVVGWEVVAAGFVVFWAVADGRPCPLVVAVAVWPPPADP